MQWGLKNWKCLVFGWLNALGFWVGFRFWKDHDDPWKVTTLPRTVHRLIDLTTVLIRGLERRKLLTTEIWMTAYLGLVWIQIPRIRNSSEIEYGRICLLAKRIYKKRIPILKYDVFMENVFSYFWKIVVC